MARLALGEPKRPQGFPGISGEETRCQAFALSTLFGRGEAWLDKLVGTSCRYAGPSPPPHKVPTNLNQNAIQTILHIRPILGLDMGIEMFKEILNFPLRRWKTFLVVEKFHAGSHFAATPSFQRSSPLAITLEQKVG